MNEEDEAEKVEVEKGVFETTIPIRPTIDPKKERVIDDILKREKCVS